MIDDDDNVEHVLSTDVEMMVVEFHKISRKFKIGSLVFGGE